MEEFRPFVLNAPQHGNGGHETSSGTQFTERRKKQIAEVEPGKLTLILGTAADKIQVVPGYVNTLMPTLSGTALNAGTPPELTITEDTWVWVKCVGTFGSPDTHVVTIETTATSDHPAGEEITATTFTSFRLLGSIDFETGSPNTYEITRIHGGGNFGVASFGNVNLWWLL